MESNSEQQTWQPNIQVDVAPREDFEDRSSATYDYPPSGQTIGGSRSAHRAAYINDHHLQKLASVEALDDPTCSICYKEAGSDHEMAQLEKCKHIFGNTCILKWLMLLATENATLTCPMCRTEYEKPPSQRIYRFYGQTQGTSPRFMIYRFGQQVVDSNGEHFDPGQVQARPVTRWLSADEVRTHLRWWRLDHAGALARRLARRGGLVEGTLFLGWNKIEVLEDQLERWEAEDW